MSDFEWAKQLVVYGRAKIAELHANEDGVSEIVAILIAVALVAGIATAVFAILKSKAQSSARHAKF